MARARANVPTADGSPAPTSMVQKLVLMSDDDWAYCQRQRDGGSPFVRGLVALQVADPTRPIPDKGGPAGTGRAVIMPPAFWEFCGANRGGGGPFIRRLIAAHREEHADGNAEENPAG